MGHGGDFSQNVSTGEGNGKPLQYSCLENPMDRMKRLNHMTLKDELSRSVGAQCATGDQRRTNSRKNEETETKQKYCPAVSLAPHERLPEILVVPREKTPTGAAARGNP